LSAPEPDKQRPAAEAKRNAGGPSIELRHLRYFVVVSEELHFRRAAERLHIAQPPLSQAIRKLEGELGVVLLERTSRAVSLTPAGRVFFDEAREVLASFERAVMEARRAGGVGSDLRVGCTPCLPIDRVLLFLSALGAKEPGARPHVKHALPVEQVRGLRSDELDLGIFPDVLDDDRIESAPLFPGDALAVFVAQGHALARKPSLTPEDFADETLVTFPAPVNPGLADWLLETLDGARYRFRERREVGGAYLRDQLLAVAAGQGVAFLPESLKEIDETGALVVRRPLEQPLWMPNTIVAWHARLPSQLRPLIATVRGIAGQLYRAQFVAASS
jgi:DNA-binding transcriptional LysR family regulator